MTNLPIPPAHTLTDWARFDAFTDEELRANALSDPDNPPVTPENAARMVRWTGGIPAKRDALAAARLEAEARVAAAPPAPPESRAIEPLLVPLDADLRAAFPTAQAVRDALHLLLRLRQELQNAVP